MMTPAVLFLFLTLFSATAFAKKPEPPPALEIRPLERTSIPAWKQPVPITLPESSEEAFFKDGNHAPAITFNRLIAHLPTRLRSLLLFPAAAEELNLDALPARVRLAHDGENLLVFLHLGLLPGRTAIDASDALGHWPMRKAPFDSRECVMIAVATGSPANVPQRAVFIDWKGNVELRHSGGTGPVVPMPDQSGAAFPKRSIVGKDGWTIIASIPFSMLFGEAPPRRFSLNVARLYSAPEGKVAPRAASLAGSFYAFRRFPVFSIRPNEDGTGPQFLGLKLGDFPENEQIPMGSHHAEAVVISEGAGTTWVRHRLRSKEGETIAMEREIQLHPGLNRLQWEWTAPEEGASTLEINGKAVASEKLTAAPRLETQPSLFVARANETLSVHTELGVGAKEARQLDLHAELLEDGKPLHRFKLPRPPGPMFDLDLHLARLPSLAPGSHTLRLTALKNDTVWATSEIPFQVEPAAPMTGKKLEIALQDASYRSVTRPHPVRTGIPFPEGALADASQLQLLDKEGRAVPFAVTPLAQWPRSRSVKWVHLDFEHDPAQSYRLVSPPVTQTNITPGVRVSEDKQTIRIDTGALLVTVGKQGFDGFREWRLGKEKPHHPAPGSFYVIDEAGIRFDSRHADGTTEIEEANSERVTLKFSGACTATDAAGKAPSPLRYILRMTFFRGAPIIDVRHSFTITTHTPYHRLRRIGLNLGLAADAVELEGASLPPVKTGPPIAIRQTNPEQRLLIRENRSREIDATARGEWRWKTPSATVGLNVADFREMAPLEVIHRSGEGVELRLWPGFPEKAPSTVATSDAEKIRLPFLHHGPLLDFEVPESYLDESKTKQQYYYLLNGLAMGDAMGVSRSQRFELVFSSPEAEKLPARAAAWFARPYVTASPRWMSESGALTSLPMAPADPDSPIPAVSRAEKVLSRSFDWERRRTEAHTMGKWTWGAMHSRWDPASETFTLYRPFRNSHHRSTRAYYYLFARSGDPKYLELAERATDYINDLGMPRHTDSDLEALSYYGKRLGGTCDYKGFVPWNSGSRYDYNTYAENFLNSWYLTGNRDSLQAVTHLHAIALEERRGSSGVGRGGASRMETVGSLYSHFRDGRLLGYLHRSFDDLKASQLPQGFIAGGVEFSTWLPEYIELTSRPEAVATLRKLAYADLARPAWYDFQGKTWQPNFDLQAYAYRRFGDPALLSQTTRRMTRTTLDSVYLKEGDPEDGYMAYYNVRWNFFSNQAPALLWALSKAGMPQWETPRETYLDYRVPRQWTTISAFQSAGSEPFELTLRGTKPPKAVVKWRIVAGDGAVLDEGVLEGLKLPELPLSNPPVDPPAMTRKIVPGAHPAPYFLQCSGSDNYLRLMTPYTSLEREVYAGGDFYSKGGSASRKNHFRFSCRYGNRPLFMQVPHGARQGDLEVSVAAGHPYRISLHSQGRKEIAVMEGFARAQSLQVPLPLNAVAQEKAEMVGIQPNVGGIIVTLEGGSSIPPWVGLSRETFFVPENPPASTR
ncbi:MAG TPA: hypothetical protein VNQ90_13350 [Chthoniobacteraceae bacterium]|nr:hypothetical protein [Chthoniobacteraceae bacterium]